MAHFVALCQVEFPNGTPDLSCALFFFLGPFRSCCLLLPLDQEPTQKPSPSLLHFVPSSSSATRLLSNNLETVNDQSLDLTSYFVLQKPDNLCWGISYSTFMFPWLRTLHIWWLYVKRGMGWYNGTTTTEKLNKENIFHYLMGRIREEDFRTFRN